MGIKKKDKILLLKELVQRLLMPPGGLPLMMTDRYACALKVFNKKDYLKIDYFKNMHRFLPALFK